ncbi:MAG: TRAP transporter large permease subunit [Gammaproteobacteria bacterium]|nr:TRAP transporter large permease subunit [Gammaproteobacteria bacterium]MCY4255365.1 TRAP transporter large permease subunit [Gammaproteobacteria bacterium]MCY4340541.1 TRAP transporter large permease subunit [Gammaproteobacteria bacterium]
MHWILLALLAVFGAPLFAVIASGAIIGYLQADVPLGSIAIEILGVATLPTLIAIPLFCLAGYVLAESPAPKLLVRLSEALVGWMPGGLAVFALAVCALFTAFTGASGVTIIAMGALLYPALKQARYPQGFSLGLVTTGGSLGLLFAPSLPLILYGVVSETRIDSLFRAGILPGLLMIALLSAYCLWVNRSERQPLASFSWREVAGAVKAASWELPLPFIVLGGIYSGYFAISEAAAVTALYVLAAEVFIRRAIPLSRLPGIIRESMTLVGGIMLILAVSLASTNLMIDAEVPQRLLSVIGEVVAGPLSFLLALLVFLLILGAFLDIFSAIVLVVPLILPIAQQFDVHPVHLGIIFLATMQLGYLTPPVGLNLFIASYRFGQPIVRVYAASLPFLLVLFAAVLLIAFWPALSLWMIET